MTARWSGKVIGTMLGRSAALGRVPRLGHPSSGQFVVMLGPSGSGKTTMLNIIGGIGTAPTAGTVRVAGRDLGALVPPARGHRLSVRRSIALRSRCRTAGSSDSCAWEASFLLSLDSSYC